MPEDSIDEALEKAEYIRRQYPGGESEAPHRDDGSDVIANEPQDWWGIED